jgi:hypothetical protein
MPAWPAFAAPGAEVTDELHAGKHGGSVAQEVLQYRHRLHSGTVGAAMDGQCL